MVTQIAQKMDIEEANDPELTELANDVHPEKVMDKIDDYKNKGNTP